MKLYVLEVWLNGEPFIPGSGEYTKTVFNDRQTAVQDFDSTAADMMSDEYMMPYKVRLSEAEFNNHILKTGTLISEDKA